MARSNVLIETYPNKGILRHNITSYLKQLVTEHLDHKERPIGVWVVRPKDLPANFDSSVAQVQLHEYDSEAVIANLVHSGNQDGPDHTLPLPWRSDLAVPVDHARSVKPWSARESYTCADLIARLLNLDAHETHQWIPSSLFAKLVLMQNSFCFKLDLEPIEQEARVVQMSSYPDDPCVDIPMPMVKP